MWNILVQKWNGKDEQFLLFETRDFGYSGHEKFVSWTVTPSGNKAEVKSCRFYRNYITIRYIPEDS